MLKKNRPRVQTSGYQLKEYYRHYRKATLDYTISEGTYGKIIRACMEQVIDRLMHFETVSLPHRIGECSIREYKPYYQQVHGRTIRRGLIDYPATLELWKECPDKIKKVYVQQDNKSVFYFKHRHARGCRKPLEYYRLMPKAKIHKDIHHRLTLRKDDTIWRSNIHP